MDPKIWNLVDTRSGKTYRSIPTAVPTRWTPSNSGSQWNGTARAHWHGGEYEIVQEPYGKRFSYTLKRKGIRLPLATYPRLKDAKARAELNARGEDSHHVA